MAQKNVLVTALPTLVTVFTAAIVLIVGVTFDGPSIGALWPAIPMALFFSLAASAFINDTTGWMPGAVFLGSFFLFLLLHTLDTLRFGKSWPFLVLITGLMIVVGILLAKSAKEKQE